MNEHITEAAFQAQEVQTLAREEMDFLAALAMPTIFQFGFPPVFKAVWQWLLNEIFRPRHFPQLALGLPRGFGKTTVIKLFILFCILFTQKKFIKNFKIKNDKQFLNRVCVNSHAQVEGVFGSVFESMNGGKGEEMAGSDPIAR